jgi:uncharacterized membrane protein SpoIIM required for sporulation
LNLDRFLAERQPSWAELEALVSRAGRRPERLGPEGVLRLGALYREAAADLALARRAFPRDPVVGRLEHLVGRARNLVYDTPPRRTSVLRFFAREYWRLVASRPLPLLVAAVLLFAPAALAGGWALRDPGTAGGLVPEEYRAVTEPRETDLGLGVEEEAAFSSAIFTNNIRVTFFAFAGGVLAGLVTAAVLAFNGVLLGTVAGLAVGAGNGGTFFELVTAHGVLELSCIVVAGAAGLRLGWALVEPGRRTRRESLVSEARATVAIVLGTAPWLVVAGLVEGFVTPEGLGLPTVLAVGLALGIVYWSLVVGRGRAPSAPGNALTGARAASPVGTR